MMVVAGHTLTLAAERGTAVSAFAPMVERARSHNGCIDFAISADPVDPRRINFLELWRDQAALDAWHEVADPPDVPTTETNVAIYRVK